MDYTNGYNTIEAATGEISIDWPINTKTRQETFYSFFEKLFVCRLDAANQHLLNEPILLPCGYIACKSCIQDSVIKVGYVECNFPKCKSKHAYSNINSLSYNRSLDDSLKENLLCLTECLVEHLQRTLDSINESKLAEYKYKVKLDKIFKQIEQDIKDQVNKIKNELNRLEERLIKIVNIKKKQLIDEDKRYLDEKKETSAKLIHLAQSYLKKFKQNQQIMRQKQQQQQLLNSNSSTKFLSLSNSCQKNESILKLYVNKCYNCINELNNFKDEQTIKLNEIKFLKSKWIPSKLNIGTLIIPNLNYSNRDSLILSNEISNINYYLKNRDYLPNVLLNDCKKKFDKNDYKLVEKNFTFINDLCKTEKTTVATSNFGVCYDNIQNIYICDFNKNAALIIDKELSKIKKIVSKHSNNSYDDDEEPEYDNVKKNTLKPLNYRFIQTIFV